MEQTLFHALWNVIIGFIPLLVLFIAIFCTLIFRRWRVAGALSVLFVFVFVVLNFGFANENLAPDLKIASFSVRSSNATAHAGVKSLLDMNNDIVAFQEVNENVRVNVINEVEGSGYFLHERFNKSTLLFSKYPIREQSYIGNIQRTLIDYKEGIVIYNIHTPKYTSNIQYYNSFFSALVEAVKQEPDLTAIIIMGDFNSVSNNYWRSMLESELGFKGALTDGGVGFLNTFPTKYRRYGKLVAFLSIDEVYIKGASSIVGRVYDEHFGSDHYPVLSRINFDK